MRLAGLDLAWHGGCRVYAPCGNSHTRVIRRVFPSQTRFGVHRKPHAHCHAERGRLSRAPLEGAFGAPRLNVALARLVDLWNDLIAFATLGQGRVLTCPAPSVFAV